MSSAPALRLSEAEVARLPPNLLPFKYPKTKEQVFTHRSYSARPSAVFEDAADDIAPDNEVLEHVGDSVLNLGVVTLVRNRYPGLRVGPHAKIKALVAGNATNAQIAQHYKLTEHLKANSSQIVALRHSTVVQADLFEAYIGGLYVDWGFEHIRPWLEKLLEPWVDAAYIKVRGDYLDVNANRPTSFPRSPPQTNLLPSNELPFETRSNAPSRPSPLSNRPTSLRNSPSIASQSHREFQSQRDLLSAPSIFTGAISFDESSRDHFYPTRLPPSVSSHMEPRYPLSPPSSQSSEPRSFAPSQTAEGHLPLLNQVTQHSRKFIDWDYRQDLDAPVATPIWDVIGRLQGVEICRGRGNQKKLAKNDAAKQLIETLQARLGNKAMTTVNLATELDSWFKEHQRIASGLGNLSIS